METRNEDDEWNENMDNLAQPIYSEENISSTSTIAKNINANKDCICDMPVSESHDICLCPVCKSYMVTPVAMSSEHPGFLVVQVKDNDLMDYKYIKFISAHRWICESSIAAIVHYKSKTYVLLSVHPDISIDDLRRIYERNGLGCVQKWLGVSMDNKRKIRFVESKAKDDGSFEFKCEIDKKVETRTPVHYLTDVIEDLSVSNPNKIISLHRGMCIVKCRKANRRLDFTPVEGMIIGYLSTIDNTRNQNKTISLLNKKFDIAQLISSNQPHQQKHKRNGTKRKFDDGEKHTNLVDIHLKKTKTKPSLSWSTNRIPRPEREAIFHYSGSEYKILDDV